MDVSAVSNGKSENRRWTYSGLCEKVAPCHSERRVLPVDDVVVGEKQVTRVVGDVVEIDKASA